MTSEFPQHLSLVDLPIGALSHVSSYLPSISRALFAVALNFHDVDSSSAIVGEKQDFLDFGDIEKESAAKLTDDNVRSVLLSIDAVNNLKTLWLTNLLNITGVGLEPLRGSSIIEKIDLSLVGDNESPDLSPAPPISCAEVLPILGSIIDIGETSSLKLLIFPKKWRWREERNTESDFHAFLVRYNALLCGRVVTCLECNNDLTVHHSHSMLEIPIGVIAYGTQNMTCYDCMKHYCHDCEEYEDGKEISFMSDLCGICNRRYCLHCSRERCCDSCEEYFCVDCMDMKQCAQCDENTCRNCISTRKCCNHCCEGKIWCDCCVEDDALIRCENCEIDYCFDCCDSNTDDLYSIYFCCDYCGEHLR